MTDVGVILRKAQAGDEEAFARLTGPYRRELLVHCYRMLGSLQDAEDVVQEALLHAWRRLDTLQQHASFRAWLYKIATNACLDALDKRPRRTLPSAVYPAADPRGSMAPPIEAPIWLEPLPDEWLVDAADNPEARYTMRESITLAFQLALQVLPPRQRAVLILRDVLGWHANEVADLLDMTISAVSSALHRARATMRRYHGADRDNAVRSLPDDERTRRLLNEYVQAWDAADIARLIALLKDDAMWIMPPLPAWYRGREAIHAFIVTQVLAASARGVGRRYIPTRANGQPAMAIYHRSQASEACQAVGLQVLTVDESAWQIAQVTTFMKPELFSRFGLAVELSE
jgi:RNA polymerase sigma-70 factor (ECF subfamily)